MKRLLSMMVLLVFALGSGACSQGSGSIDGGSLLVRDCERRDALRRFDPFQMSLGFMALERDDDVVVMRFHEEETWMPLNDSLTMTVDDFSTIRAEIATAGSTVRTQDNGVRVGLIMLGTCPASTAAMEARTVDVTFDALAVDGGDRVTFSMTFDLFDARTGEQVGFDLSAQGDFEVVLGTPYQQFSDPNSQKH